MNTFLAANRTLISLNTQTPIVGHLPDLTHTRLRTTAVNGERLVGCNWRLLQREMISQFLNRRSLAKLVKLNLGGVVVGKKKDKGYVYDRALNVSIRAQGSNVTADNIAKLARSLGSTVHVGYIHPRNRAVLRHATIG